MPTRYRTSDVRITQIEELVPPSRVRRELPIDDAAANTVSQTRQAIQAVLHGKDDRIVVIFGPCSIHDIEAAKDYAARLRAVQERLAADLIIAMRVYFEKPRTTVGWKGLINDPHLDGTFKINDGLRIARKLLLELNQSGMAAGCEFLDTVTPQYIADLVSWGAIGARTTGTQVHREMASGLSCPIGFKNGTDGNVNIAVDAIRVARTPHHFLGVTKGGHTAIVSTTGNDDCHLVLRGGQTPNFDAVGVQAACRALSEAGLPEKVMVDFSHANSSKNPAKQMDAGEDVARQIAAGDARIIGVMAESHLKSGRQDHVRGKPLVYGVSITDGCIGWQESEALLETLAGAVRERRRLKVAM
jgi:3-deoxy-7-phosphoheptulonate synthase